MPDSNVSSCVLNILGSFSSSLNLYKKLREQRRKKKRSKRNGVAEGEELRLSMSLRQGHDDITQEYQQSVYAVGDQFAIGDAIAQTSLAEILLRLNVGLIGIITSFLHNDRNDVQLDYRSLSDLSDRSRIDTCRALRQLFKRLTHFKPQMAITSREVVEAGDRDDARNDSQVSSNRKKSREQPGRTKIRGPTLAQVYIQDSSKRPQIALVRPGERRRKSRSSSGTESSLSKSNSDTKSASSASTPPPEYTARQASTRPAERVNTVADARQPRRKQSAANIPNKSSARNGDHLRATKSTPRLHSTLQEPVEPLPPMPNTAPLPAASTTTLIPRRRKPTPTFYSIATDSTKLGEIPLHKWTTPWDFDQMSVLNQEAYRNGWPNGPANAETRKKRAGFFGLFRRRTE